MLMLAAAAAAAGADFSHRVHLKLKLACTQCHTAARASTKADDNLLPSAASCKPCHESRTIRTTRTPTTVVHFSHALHVKLFPQKCEGCHRGLEQSDKVTKAAFPRMEDCLVCHTKIDPPDSCAQCHVPGPQLKPASHTSNWGDLHTHAKIEKQSCWVCHGKKFHCQGCH